MYFWVIVHAGSIIHEKFSEFYGGHCIIFGRDLIMLRISFLALQFCSEIVDWY